MSHNTFKVLHLLGVITAFMSIGAIAIRAFLENPGVRDRAHKIAGWTHAIAFLLLLVSGFGMLAKLKVGFPGWVIAKLAIWVALGGIIALPRRKPELAWAWWILSALLGGLAAYFGVMKPF